MSATESEPAPVLVTGATGYVGGRLVPRLLELGFRVRVLARDPARLEGRAWLDQVEAVRGDVLCPETLAAALEGVTCAWYLIHSMAEVDDFAARDEAAAHNFGAAAAAAGVQRIVYLGGLGDPESDLSHHLRSRQQTGAALGAAGVPVTEFRASIVVGSGSISFEMIRYLTERLPLMICPRWVYTRVQPIAIADVVEYLAAAPACPAAAGRIVEIGGADVLSYGRMMLGYAKVRGLRRWLLAVPLLTPRLSSLWVHLVTPVPSRIAKPLILGLRNETIVHDTEGAALFPGIVPMGYEPALRRALERLDASRVETTWSDALATSMGAREAATFTGVQEGMWIEARRRKVDAPPAAVFRAFTGLGGRRGWLYLDFLWRLRGGLDRLVGGVGFRRGRRHPDTLRAGDALDFWRVEEVYAGQRLLLRAEMKVPGRAWLQFTVESDPAGGSQFEQTAFFAPKGLAGQAYWLLIYPLHALIFSGLARRIGALAERLHAGARE